MIDVISSKNEYALQSSLSQLKGNIQKKIKESASFYRENPVKVLLEALRVVFTCPNSVSALFLRIGELRDDAAHDMRIRSRQCFADPEQEIHLRWRELYFAWFVPVSKFDAATVSA